MRFQEFILDSKENDLKDILNTANTGRTHFQCRATVVGKTKQEILKNLQSAGKAVAPEDPPKVCFLFTGQGSQYMGMGKALYDTSPIFKMHFDRCDRILTSLWNFDSRCYLGK
jgi:acyl transferase domain-containing protein